jgi:hypothetical protein
MAAEAISLRRRGRRGRNGAPDHRIVSMPENDGQAERLIGPADLIASAAPVPVKIDVPRFTGRRGARSGEGQITGPSSITYLVGLGGTVSQGGRRFRLTGVEVLTKVRDHVVLRAVFTESVPPSG